MGKIIEHDLLPKQKPRKSNLKVKVDLSIMQLSYIMNYQKLVLFSA
jgi:hypothetical protein